MKGLRLAPGEWLDLEPGPPHPCPYLAGRQMLLRAGIAAPDEAALDVLLAAGFRRLGLVFYQPRCEGCAECVPIRVPIAAFAPSHSQRRLWRSWAARYEVTVAPCTFSPEHLALHQVHSAHVAEDNPEPTEETYRACFMNSLVPTWTIEYRIDGALVAVSILDEGARSVSSVYVSWDPAYHRASPGTFTALWEMRWAQERGRDYYYLGYFVADCARMSYKARFAPNQRLRWQSGRWRLGPASCTTQRGGV